MDNIRDTLNSCKNQIVNCVQIHSFFGKQMTYINTILRQVSKLISRKFNIKFIDHAYPQNSLQKQLPFSIINSKFVKDKKATLNLLLLLMQLTRNKGLRQNEQNEQIIKSTTKINPLLLAIVKQCEQFCQFANYVGQQYQNPYWLFLNPIFKLKQNKIMNNKKINFLRNTQYFDINNNINQDYFIYKLSLLQEFVKKTQQTCNIVQYKFIQICILALLKHLKIHCQKLYKSVTIVPFFKFYQQNLFNILTQIKQYSQNISSQNIPNGTYAHFSLNPIINQKPKQPQYQTLKQKCINNLALPICITTLLLIGKKLLS